jgi:hypothetical protein
MKPKPTLQDIRKYLHGQRIVLIGNAKSALKTPKKIDVFDRVIRLNKGYPRGKEKSLGSRTDILGLAIDLKEHEIKKEFDPHMIMWMAMPHWKKDPGHYLNRISKMSKNARRRMPQSRGKGPRPHCHSNPYIDSVSYQTDLPLWKSCLHKVGSRPSTGCLMIHFLVNNVKFKSLTLVGFDWWKSPTWYYESGPGPHSPLSEKCYVNALKSHYNIKIIDG